MEISVIERYAEPSKNDTAPFKTICKTSCPKAALYVQVSKDCDNPEWILLETFNCPITDDIIEIEIQKISDILK